jgi:trk system potassium uptake protein TrkA
MRVIIVGCGRVGSTLARQLGESGHGVTIIDLNQEAFLRLGSDFQGTTLLGTGIDEDVLRKAGIESADAFVAVTNRDNTNAMASQIAKEIFHVRRVIARLYDPIREEIYQTLGLDTVSPTRIGVERIMEKLHEQEAMDTHPNAQA